MTDTKKRRVWILEMRFRNQGRWQPYDTDFSRKRILKSKKAEEKIWPEMCYRVRCAVLLPLKKGKKHEAD